MVGLFGVRPHPAIRCQVPDLVRSSGSDMDMGMSFSSSMSGPAGARGFVCAASVASVAGVREASCGLILRWGKTQAVATQYVS